MATRTRTSRTKRTNRDYIRGLARARLERIFKHALEEHRYGIALEAVMAQCRLSGIRIDPPSRSGAPLSPEALQQLMTDAETRRDS